MTGMKRLMAGLGALLITTASGVRGAAITFTGDVATDFTGGPPYVVLSDSTDVSGLEGWAVKELWMAWGGPSDDTLYVGARMRVSDPQPRFGVVSENDSPLVGVGEYVGLALDLNVDGAYDAVVGVPLLGSLTDAARPFGVYSYNTGVWSPATSFGTLQSTDPATGHPLSYYAVDPGAIDFEFAIGRFTSLGTTLGIIDTAPLSMGVAFYAGSASDEVGERVLLPGFVVVPEPGSALILVLALLSIGCGRNPRSRLGGSSPGFA